jgi:hypothetical protein
MKLRIEEGKDRDRPVDALVQVLIHEVGVLVAQKEAQIEFAALGGESPQDRHIGNRVATPVFGDHQHVQRFGKIGEERNVVGREFNSALVLFQSFTVAGHPGFVFGVGHALFKTFACDGHGLLVLLALSAFVT